MPSILFVCTANQFRSPLAAAFFAHKYQTMGWQSDWLIGSAGTWALPGCPAMPSAIQSAYRLGISLSEHRSQQVSASLISIQDLILVMDSGQKEALQVEFSIFRRRIFLLSEVVDGWVENIPDPVTNESVSPYEIALKIRDMIDHGYYRICAQALKANRTQPLAFTAAQAG